MDCVIASSAAFQYPFLLAPVCGLVLVFASFCPRARHDKVGLSICSVALSLPVWTFDISIQLHFPAFFLPSALAHSLSPRLPRRMRLEAKSCPWLEVSYPYRTRSRAPSTKHNRMGGWTESGTPLGGAFLLLLSLLETMEPLEGR